MVDFDASCFDGVHSILGEYVIYAHSNDLTETVKGLVTTRNEISDFGQTRNRSKGLTLEIRKAVLPDPQRGDQVTVRDITYVVKDVIPHEDTNDLWVLDLYRS